MFHVHQTKPILSCLTFLYDLICKGVEMHIFTEKPFAFFFMFVSQESIGLFLFKVEKGGVSQNSEMLFP